MFKTKSNIDCNLVVYPVNSIKNKVLVRIVESPWEPLIGDIVFKTDTLRAKNIVNLSTGVVDDYSDETKVVVLDKSEVVTLHN